MSSKKKRSKKQATADNSQLMKGVVACVVIVGGIYCFSQLGGGSSPSATTIVALAPVRPAQGNNGPVQAAGNQQDRAGSKQPAAQEPFSKPDVTPDASSDSDQTPPMPLNMIPGQNNNSLVKPQPKVTPFASSNGFAMNKSEDKTGNANLLNKNDPKGLQKKRKDITGTERGNQLFSEINQLELRIVFQGEVISEESAKAFLQKHAELAMDKTEIELFLEKPEGNIPFMLLTLNATPLKKGSQEVLELSVRASLVVVDPEEKSENKLVILWKIAETDIGTVVPQAVAQGIIPRVMGEKLTRFLNKFRSAQAKATRLSK